MKWGVGIEVKCSRLWKVCADKHRNPIKPFQFGRSQLSVGNLAC